MSRRMGLIGTSVFWCRLLGVLLPSNPRVTTGSHLTPHQPQAHSRIQCWPLLSLMLLPVLRFSSPFLLILLLTTMLLGSCYMCPFILLLQSDTGHFFAADSASTATSVLAPSPAPSSISHFASPPGLYTFGLRRCFESELLLKARVLSLSCSWRSAGSAPGLVDDTSRPRMLHLNRAITGH